MVTEPEQTDDVIEGEAPPEWGGTEPIPPVDFTGATPAAPPSPANELAAAAPTGHGNALTDLGTLQATTGHAEEWMAILADWMGRNLQPGRDYGAIEGKSFKGKPTLLKPGAERITLALGLRAVFVEDRPTYEMAGSPRGLIAYRCILVDRAGADVGEGRGACSQDEKPTINNCIKFAEKRAQVDAVLRLAGLSAYFVTEEDDETRPAPKSAPRQRVEAPNAGQNSGAHNVAPGASNRPAQNPDRAAVVAVFRTRHPLATSAELGGLILEWMQNHVDKGINKDTITARDWAKSREILEAGPASPPRSSQELASEIFV